MYMREYKGIKGNEEAEWGYEGYIGIREWGFGEVGIFWFVREV